MDVTIVADQGTHLLIRQGDRFAVIERRSNLLYRCNDGKREPIRADHIEAVPTILEDGDWADEATAAARFNEIVARGTHLGQTMR